MRNSSFLSIKNIVAIGIGSAVFLVLGRFGSIPTGIPNTNLEVAYAFLALMAIIYGPVSGFFNRIYWTCFKRYVILRYSMV